MTTETQAPDPAPADDLDNPAYGITDERINALIKASEVFEYHPGAILEFAREVAKEAVADDFLRTHAIEELHQLGYTVKDGNRLVPPDHLHLLMQAARHPLAAIPAPEGAERATFERWMSHQSSPLHLYGLGRDESDRYGVAIVQAAWWAWQARAALAAPAPQDSLDSAQSSKGVAMQAPAEAHGDKWEGAEEWMPLAWELCANECGEEACTELIWEGGPIPEPWGDRWLKYEDQAKEMIAMVRKHVRAPSDVQPKGTPAGYVTAIEEGKVLMMPRPSLDTAGLVPVYAAAQAPAPVHELMDQLIKAQEQRDELRQALEVIALGDAEDPVRDAGDTLVELGWWSGEALAASRAETQGPAVGARQLTSEELADCCGGCRSNSAIETWMRRAIEKFCEVNGISHTPVQHGKEQVPFADGENPCVLEWGAVSLPLGDPSRITEMKLYPTLWDAIAEGALCGFDWRVYPLALKPRPESEPPVQPIGGE